MDDKSQNQLKNLLTISKMTATPKFPC